MHHFYFYILKTFQTYFCSGCTNLHSCPCIKTVSSTFLPALDILTSVDFISFCDIHSDLDEMKLNIVLVCISLMASDSEHFFFISLWSSVLLLKKCSDHLFIDWIMLFF